LEILEFVQVLLAIILGLGMAGLLRGYADFLRPGNRQFSGLLFGFSLWLFLRLSSFGGLEGDLVCTIVQSWQAMHPG
jgi:tellurite resistance protein TehA-like permease